jgi:diguanylate cyclase (GGDEF)-like protein
MHQRDPLTGLSNRTHFVSALGDTLKTPGGVLFGLTVNQLAALNQTLGHTACDRLLVQIARQLRELLDNQTPVARITGGQFAVLLDAKAASGAETLARKLNHMVATLTASEADRTMKPDVTIQRLQLEARHKDRQAIMDQVFKTDIQAAPAASAPKAAKVAATPATISKPQAAQAPAPAFQPAASRASDNWAEAVQNALAHNQMQLLFQPIINLHGEPRCLYEAQLTLRTLDGKVVPPSEYLPSAEAIGLGGKIDRNLMLNVIDTLSKYRLDGRPGTVFVGLTSAAVQDSALLAAIQMHLKATGLDPADLILQLDEAVLAQHPDAAGRFIENARAMGMGIAVDNFTGQAVSHETLAGLNADFLGMNCGLDGLKEDALISAIDAALALERVIVAKRIEDANVFTGLFSRGVHYVQGDYLQPASPGLDYSFESEQTLASDEPLAPTRRVAG